MRTHSEIIGDATGIRKLQELFPAVSEHSIRSWRQRNSIPGEYWAGIAAAEIASLDELAKAVAKDKAA